MNKRFSYDNIIKSRSIEANDVIRTYKLDRCCDFMELKYNNPKLTQKQICNQLGFSDSTIKRYRDDIKMDSPYNRNNYKKRRPKKEPDNTTEVNKKDIEESSKNKIIEKRIKNRLKNEIKGCNTLSGTYIDNDKHLSGKELIEQAFKGTIND